MTAQELRKLIEEKEQKFAVSGSSLPASAQAVIKKQISDMKSQLETLEKAEKDVKSAEKTDDEKKIEKAEQKLEDKEKKVESKVESAEKEIKKTVKKGMTEAQKRAAEKYRQKQKEKKEADKKKKEAAEKAKATKKKRAKKTTKVEAKAKRKPAQKSAPKKSAPKKSAPKSKRKKRATKKETISSFLAKNKTARQKYKGVSMASKKRDADVPAKPFGYRLAGTNRRPTKAEIKSGKAYWEGRPTKADVRRTGYPKLEQGGEINDNQNFAEGGFVGSPNHPELLAGGNYFAKGGGIFNLGGDGRGNRTHHNEGAAWTLDHYQHNKSEDYEVPMRSRKHKKKKYDEGGEIVEQEIGETTVENKPQTKSGAKSGEANSGAGEAKESMWLVLLKDSDEDEVFEIVSAENEDDAYEQAEKLNKGAKATGIKLLIDETGKNTMFKRGGKVKSRKTKYTYLPQHEIAYITTWDGVIIDAEDILDGAYIRGRRKFEEGGQVWSGSAEGVEGAGMFDKGGGITENPYEYAKDKAQGLVSKAKEVSGFAKGGVIGDREYNRITSGEKLYEYRDGSIDGFSFSTKSIGLVEVYKKYGSIFIIKRIGNSNSYHLNTLSAKDTSRLQSYFKKLSRNSEGVEEGAIEKGWMKKGGRVKRSKGNSPSGRAWTLDHYQHNKREDYEVPMRDRKHKK